MKKYYCELCGAEFELEDDAELVCPICGAGEDELKEIKDDE